MSDLIFINEEKDVELGNNLMSFKDCPNKCVNGYYTNPYKHKKILCEYCAEKRKAMVRKSLTDKNSGKDIKKLLNLPNSFTGTEFNADSVIPEFALKDIKEESIAEVKDSMMKLVQDASVGTVPEYSYMFNLGKKVYEGNFIYTYLTRAYMSGLTVSPYISALDLCRLRNMEELGKYPEDEPFRYKDFLSTDICVVVIDAGATYNSINAVKGLMQLRASKGYATIIFTNAWGSQIYDLCTEGDEVALNLAKLVSIEYTDAYKNRESKYVDTAKSSNSTHTGFSSSALTTEQFNNLLSPKKSL